MGLFDAVMGVVSSQLQQHGGMTGVVVGLLANNSEHGGINGLMGKFTQAGLGNVVQSWIGTGQNLPVSAEQITSVLGNSTVATIAKQLGVEPQSAAGQLAQMLPTVIDQLTPKGNAPQSGFDAGDLMKLASSFMNNR
ncbi:MAG: hypothetical protein RIR79_2223 [Pseudomonadota bacterium]|jgi:uncharacterized protein YidB (DUF937 family)